MPARNHHRRELHDAFCWQMSWHRWRPDALFAITNRFSYPPRNSRLQPLKRADTAPRADATHRHGVPFASSRANCGKTGFAVWGGYFANLTSVSSPELANVPGAMQLPG
ncbi:TPA: hypothetical protein ACUE67_004934 [Escherichia coli]